MICFRTRVAFCLVVLSLLSGCTFADPTSYSFNRGKDLIEALHLNVTGVGKGVCLHAGPAWLGFYDYDGASGGRTMLGLGGVHSYGFSARRKTGVIFHTPSQRKGEFTDDLRRQYRNLESPWGAIGFELGYELGIGMRFDPVEFVDALLGFANIDILRDDHRRFQAGKHQDLVGMTKDEALLKLDYPRTFPPVSVHNGNTITTLARYRGMTLVFKDKRVVSVERNGSAAR